MHPFSDDTTTDFPVVMQATPQLQRVWDELMVEQPLVDYPLESFKLISFHISDNAMIADSILNQPDTSMPVGEFDLTPAEDVAGIGAYARYCAVVGTTWDGRPLPAWTMLTDKIRKGWAEAGCQYPIPSAGQA